MKVQMNIHQLACSIAVGLALISGVLSAGVMEEVSQVRLAWEQAKYKTVEKDQEAAFAALSERAQSLLKSYPKDASVAIWYGIIEASYAGAKGGLGALSLVENAKKSFEDALAIDPSALNGSAYTSLGSLYYQVPGWPIGFGDDKMAKEMLLKGLELNPDGIDSNFFYGDFLFQSGDLDGAEKGLKKALAAAPREGRAIADEGRRAEINLLLEKIAKKRS